LFWKGIVAHSTVRIAAGAGVVAASLLIVGPNPAPAFADRPDYSNDEYLSNSSGPGGFVQRGANIVKDVISGINNAGAGTSKPDRDPPKMELGSANEDLMAQGFAPEPQMAMRSAAVPEAPVGDNLAVAVPGGGGSGYSGQPVTAFHSPRVTIGNGRTPGTQVGRRPSVSEGVLGYEALDATEAAPAAPPPPTGIEIDIPPLPPPSPVERIGPAQLVVGEFGYGTADTVTDPLAGVAGLFLIPAIGAVLGYRQARAAQSLRESLRT
jgi:hypothetical protein